MEFKDKHDHSSISSRRMSNSKLFEPQPWGRGMRFLIETMPPLHSDCRTTVYNTLTRACKIRQCPILSEPRSLHPFGWQSTFIPLTFWRCAKGYVNLPLISSYQTSNYITIHQIQHTNRWRNVPSVKAFQCWRHQGWGWTLLEALRGEK